MKAAVYAIVAGLREKSSNAEGPKLDDDPPDSNPFFRREFGASDMLIKTHGKYFLTKTTGKYSAPQLWILRNVRRAAQFGDASNFGNHQNLVSRFLLEVLGGELGKNARDSMRKAGPLSDPISAQNTAGYPGTTKDVKYAAVGLATWGIFNGKIDNVKRIENIKFYRPGAFGEILLNNNGGDGAPELPEAVPVASIAKTLAKEDPIDATKLQKHPAPVWDSGLFLQNLVKNPVDSTNYVRSETNGYVGNWYRPWLEDTAYVAPTSDILKRPSQFKPSGDAIEDAQRAVANVMAAITSVISVFWQATQVFL